MLSLLHVLYERDASKFLHFSKVIYWRPVSDSMFMFHYDLYIYGFFLFLCTSYIVTTDIGSVRTTIDRFLSYGSEGFMTHFATCTAFLLQTILREQYQKHLPI